MRKKHNTHKHQYPRGILVDIICPTCDSNEYRRKHGSKQHAQDHKKGGECNVHNKPQHVQCMWAFGMR